MVLINLNVTDKKYGIPTPLVPILSNSIECELDRLSAENIEFRKLIFDKPDVVFTIVVNGHLRYSPDRFAKAALILMENPYGMNIPLMLYGWDKLI